MGKTVGKKPSPRSIQVGEGTGMGQLTVRKIEALAKPGLYDDGGTLCLHVAPGGSKSLIQRLVVHGRRRDIGLGGFPLVRLSEAQAARVDGVLGAIPGPLVHYGQGTQRRSNHPVTCSAPSSDQRKLPDATASSR